MIRHPNDKNPHDAACESALNKIDAQAGQGVDAFYAMAFRDGWQAHGAAGASEGQASRERFEAHQGGNIEKRANGDYARWRDQNDWQLWQAAERSAAAETAALRERIKELERDIELSQKLR